MALKLTDKKRVLESLLQMPKKKLPNLFASEIVGVQPMTGPDSMIFYQKYRYTSKACGDGYISNVETVTIRV